MTNRNRVLLLALPVLAAVACGRKGDSGQMANGGVRDTTQITADIPNSATLPPGAPLPPPPPPQPRPAPPPPTKAPPAAPPAAQPGRATVDSGATIVTTAVDSIHSHVTKKGDVVHLRVLNDVTDAAGRVAIPAGAVVLMRVDSIAMAPSKGASGTLLMTATGVDFGGSSRPINAQATEFVYDMKARGIGVGEVAKTGAGAAVGAIVGRVIGGKTGTIIGAVGGAAAGAAIANKEQDRDIIIHAGNRVTLTVQRTFTR